MNQQANVQTRRQESFDRLCAGLDRIRERVHVGVIYNGDRKQPGAVIHEGRNLRSEKSYKYVAEDIAAGLRQAGFRRVSLLPDDLTLPGRLRAEGIDLAWLNTAGVQGYDAIAHTPSMLELSGVPYIGHRPLLSLTLDSKHVFKRECQAVGLPTPPFMVWDGVRGRLAPDSDPRFQAVFGGHQGAYVVKPVVGRASQNVFYVPERAGLSEIVDRVYAESLDQVQIETFMGGPEYCVAISGPVVVRGGAPSLLAEPFAFSVLERLTDVGEPIFTSMDVRPITADRVRLLTADDPAHAGLVDLARRVHADFQLRALVRLDIRADTDGRLSILEANPKPDLKRPEGERISLVCAGLEAEGMSYEDLLLSLLLDRLGHYLRHRPMVVRHIAALL